MKLNLIWSIQVCYLHACIITPVAMHALLSGPPPPSEVQIHCPIVAWRHPSNVSCDVIVGYDIRLHNPNTGQESVRMYSHLDHYGTFHIIEDDINHFLLTDETEVQVCTVNYLEIITLILY